MAVQGDLYVVFGLMAILNEPVGSRHVKLIIKHTSISTNLETWESELVKITHINGQIICIIRMLITSLF